MKCNISIVKIYTKWDICSNLGKCMLHSLLSHLCDTVTKRNRDWRHLLSSQYIMVGTLGHGADLDHGNSEPLILWHQQVAKGCGCRWKQITSSRFNLKDSVNHVPKFHNQPNSSLSKYSNTWAGGEVGFQVPAISNPDALTYIHSNNEF